MSIKIKSIAIWIILYVGMSSAGQSYYVDPQHGNDKNNGSLEKPFASLDKALQTVDRRVKAGQKSDRIFLRQGIYRKSSLKTLWNLNLVGTPDNYAVLSAMPSKPNTAGTVKRKSGQWYERVIFDDGYRIKTRWQRLRPGSPIWKTRPGYVNHEWTHQNLWPWTGTDKGYPLSKQDDTPLTTTFTVAPYMLLQDNQPTEWVDDLADIHHQGQRTYDHQQGILYLWPLQDKNPNTCLIETWYGGAQDVETGELLLDGEGRGLFDGNLIYAAIRGCEFRMFTRLFEFHRRGYKQEQDRDIQHHVIFEDNHCEYGWINILLDANTIYDQDDELIKPRYDDRHHWRVRNNVFYRPSREVCQLHGDNHIIEHNIIIDHGHAWAGPASCVSAINTRNTRNAQIRYNFIHGQGNSQWHSGSVFMIEVSGKQHTDQKGDYLLGGQTFEHNIIANVTAGKAMVLGKGNTRMKDITVRYNIFFNSPNDDAIRLSSPHENLIIENNLFYAQKCAIAVKNKNSMHTPPLPSKISIGKNIFINNGCNIDSVLYRLLEKGELEIERNHFHNPSDSGRTIEFKDPEALDFRPCGREQIEFEGQVIGPFTPDGFIWPGTEWYEMVAEYLNPSH